MPRWTLPAATSCLLLLSQALAGQQFQLQTGAVPGPVVWSEAALAFDADGDGWPDVIVANGVGFSGGGGALAPTLLMNQAVPGQAVFADETATRIPAGFQIQGKGLTAADIDGDGDDDLLFAVAFGNQPRVLVNDGAGHFSDETATRLPTVNLNSFGVGAGDVDGDGDLDVIFCDAGPSFPGGPGGLARLFINDGTGHFADAPGQMNAVPKAGAQQVNLVDVDNDFDLDVIVDGRSSPQQLYVNDGSGNFTYTPGIIPAGSGATYETDWVDLDDDGDEDTFYISLSGFDEGTGENTLETGSLGFTSTTSTLSGINGHDDNEVAFIDANDDGLLDPLVASLSGPREKLYLNMGTFQANSFVYQASAFPAGSDSTLDLCLADFDQNGAYDVFTAQGESGNFTNKLYLNTGPIDTHAPFIGGVQDLGATVPLSTALAGLQVRVRLHDATSDNGRGFATASLHVTYTKGAFAQSVILPMTFVGGGMHAAMLPIPSPPEGQVGMDITYFVEATDPQGNTSQSSSITARLCGLETYGASSAVNHLQLTAQPLPVVGVTMTFNVTGGPALGGGALLFSGARANLPALGGTLLVDITNPFVFPLQLDANGSGSVPVPIPAAPVVIGLGAVSQAIVYEPALPQQYAFSNGIELVACGFQGPPPTITSVSPVGAAAGVVVTISGSGFQPGAQVDIDGVPVTVSSVQGGQITFLAPATSGCDQTLTVTNPDGQSASTPWSPTPLITNTIFSSGPAAGGVTFIMTGQFFVPGTTVTIGGAAATVTQLSGSLVLVSTPPGTVGPANVIVTTPAGCTATTTYTYL
ncbi:MAG TPA: hypothetical protein ENK43_06530 [Planctomycetes bacterium]|nr:hypothetical protein [Planctomycetota bacterium]